MKFKGTLVILYGILLLVGGVIGYLKAHSIYSLAMGSTTGCIAILSGMGMRSRYQLARLIAILLAAVNTFFFAYRFAITNLFMPAGLMAVISLAVFLILIIGSRKD